MQKLTIYSAAIIVIFLGSCRHKQASAPGSNSKAIAPFAGQALIDSLMPLLPKMREDTNKVKLLTGIGAAYTETGKYDDAKKYLKQGLSLSEQLAWQYGKARAHHNMGYCYNAEADFRGAVPEFNTAIQLYDEHNSGHIKELAECYYNLATAHKYLGYPDKESDYFNKAMVIFTKTGDKLNIARTLNCIGGIYQRRGQYDTCIKNFEQALTICEEIDYKKGCSINNRFIGYTYNIMGDYVKAMKYFVKAQKISEELENKGELGEVLLDIGQVYENQQDFQHALGTYERALKIFEATGDKAGIGAIYICMANIYSTTKDYSLCETYALKALEFGKKAHITQFVSLANQILGGLYINQKKYADALRIDDENIQRYEQLRDSPNLCNPLEGKGDLYLMAYRDKTGGVLKDLHVTRKMAMQQAFKYYTMALEMNKRVGILNNLGNVFGAFSDLYNATGDYKNALKYQKLRDSLFDTLISQERVKAINEMKEKYESEKKDASIALLNKDKAIQTMALKKQRQSKNFLIGGFILIAVVSLVGYNNYRTRHQLKLQTLRNKIARDLHDDVGSTLSSIAIFSQMAQEQSKEVQPLLATIEDSSRKMLDAMADIVWTINPENDQFEKIIQRMRSFAYELLGARNIDFEFTADEEAGKAKLSMEARKNLYLIFKEATNNMVKYAGADKAMFAIKEDKKYLTMLIRDNGKGFDINQSTLGNGLKNMKKRAEEIGASLTIDSAPGNGTSINLRMAV